MWYSLSRHGAVLLFAWAFLFHGCRDVSLLNSGGRIEGYRIEGTVLDGLDRPIENVAVSLFYVVDFISNTPVPDRSYTLQSPGEFVVVDVFDSGNNLVRNLYAEAPSGSTITVLWDQRGNGGGLVGSGVYSVRYIVSGQIRHSYVEVVNGRVTAVTDANGLFTIPDANLPVGYFPAPLYSQNGGFTGNYRIMNWVYLDFVIGTITYTYSVVLEADKISRVLVRAN